MFWDTNEMVGCCGIGVVYSIWYESYESPVTEAGFNREVPRMTKSLRGYKSWLLTITDKNKQEFEWFKMALDMSGWNLLSKYPSNHSKKYHIYMFEYRKPVVKRKKK